MKKSSHTSFYKYTCNFRDSGSSIFIIHFVFKSLEGLLICGPSLIQNVVFLVLLILEICIRVLDITFSINFTIVKFVPTMNFLTVGKRPTIMIIVTKYDNYDMSCVAPWTITPNCLRMNAIKLTESSDARIWH